jgi:hypothetical protein
VSAAIQKLKPVASVRHRPLPPTPPPAPPPPTLGQLLSNFASAATRAAEHAATHGLASLWVTEEQFQARLAVCRTGCAHWSEEAALGTGRCLHPACGCTRLKHHLTTETCPINAWPKVSAPES